MAEIEWRASPPPAPEPRGLDTYPAARGERLPTAPETGPLVLLLNEAWQAIDMHLASDLAHEQGGVLAGRPHVDPESGQVFIDVSAVAPALGAKGSPFHLQFTAEAWDYMSALLAAEHPDLMVVGWYHSHPGLGVFMSGTDRATQRAFFTQPWHLALVVDPVSDQAAWFAGAGCEPVPAVHVVRYGRQPARAPAAAPALPGVPVLPGTAERPIEVKVQPALRTRIRARRARSGWRTALALSLLLVVIYRLWRLVARQGR